jgi:hypothetical protein
MTLSSNDIVAALLHRGTRSSAHDSELAAPWQAEAQLSWTVQPC